MTWVLLGCTMQNKKLDPAVISTTAYVGIVSAILSVLMQVVFLLISKRDITVLLGNLFGLIVAVGNFFLMAYTVQKAVEKDEKDARNTIKLSQTGRFFALLIFAIIGYLIPVFNTIALVIPYLFPRIAVALSPIFNKDK